MYFTMTPSGAVHPLTCWTISTQEADEKTSHPSLPHTVPWPQPARMSCPLPTPAIQRQHGTPDSTA